MAYQSGTIPYQLATILQPSNILNRYKAKTIMILDSAWDARNSRLLYRCLELETGTNGDYSHPFIEKYYNIYD